MNRERIDHRCLTSRGELDQVDPVLVAVEARGLGINRQQRRSLESSNQCVERLPGENVVDGRSLAAGVAHGWAHTAGGTYRTRRWSSIRGWASWSEPGERLPTANRRVKIGRITIILQLETRSPVSLAVTTSLSCFH